LVWRGQGSNPRPTARWRTLYHCAAELRTIVLTYDNVSKSDILGPIDYLCDIENVVSLERAMFEDYGFKYRIKIFLLFMLLSLLLNTSLGASWTEYMSNIRAIHFYQYILGLFNKIILQRYDIFISFVKNIDTEPF